VNWPVMTVEPDLCADLRAGEDVAVQHDRDTTLRVARRCAGGRARERGPRATVGEVHRHRPRSAGEVDLRVADVSAFENRWPQLDQHAVVVGQHDRTVRVRHSRNGVGRSEADNGVK
jgi:hypothetical protein